MAKKILIVEDDKFLRELIAKKLSEEGFIVEEASDGEEGIRKIKEDLETKPIPVIILSNLGQREDIERGLKLGAFDYLVKAHFTPGEVIEKVRNALR